MCVPSVNEVGFLLEHLFGYMLQKLKVLCTATLELISFPHFSVL